MSNEEFSGYEPDLISLLDEEGNEYEFQILDELDYKDSHFYALQPLFDLPEQEIDSENTYMIFEAVEDENGKPQLAEIEDELLIDELAEIFESRFEENDYEDVSALDGDDENE